MPGSGSLYINKPINPKTKFFEKIVFHKLYNPFKAADILVLIDVPSLQQERGSLNKTAMSVPTSDLVHNG